jgi:hypothetical protein
MKGCMIRSISPSDTRFGGILLKQEYLLCRAGEEYCDGNQPPISDAIRTHLKIFKVEAQLSLIRCSLS